MLPATVCRNRVHNDGNNNIGIAAPVEIIIGGSYPGTRGYGRILGPAASSTRTALAPREAFELGVVGLRGRDRA